MRYLLAVALVVSSSVVGIYRAPQAFADQITTRSLTLETGAAGFAGSTPAEEVQHTFTFDVPSTTPTIGSIRFEYCTTAAVTACSTPSNLDTTNVNLTAEGANATGFTESAPTTNSVLLTKATAASPTGATLSYSLDGILNPDQADYTFFVRISVYSSIDGTGTATDTGSVAAATTNPIVFTGVVPETLVFCTGATVSLDCSTVDASDIDLGLFSPTTATTAESEMAVSTNAESGYVITVVGPTLNSAGNTITAIGGTATTSSTGTAQFGLNLKLNSSPAAVGAEVNPGVDATHTGSASAPYATADNYAFVADTTQTVASSTGPSAAQEFRVSYLVNVPGNQPAGTYTTTLTYICTPTF